MFTTEKLKKKKFFFFYIHLKIVIYIITNREKKTNLFILEYIVKVTDKQCHRPNMQATE